MASRELIYRITLSTSDAKRQARNIRSVLEAELRTIQVGKLDLSSIHNAVSQAHQLRLEFEQAAQAARQVGNTSSSIQAPSAPVAPPAATGGGINTGALLAGAGAYITLQSAKAVANYVVESAKLDTQIRRTEAAFEFLAGGAAQAEARLIAIQRASNGTIDRMGAMEAANQIAALGLAKTATEFENLARAAKIVSTYSSQIRTFDDAISQLGLFANASGFQRADQLLINSAELVKRMHELQAADSSLTDQQAKLKASVDLLNQSFGPMLDSTAAQASGAEKLAVAWSEFTNQKSALGATFNTIISGVAGLVDEMSTLSGFGSSRAILEVTKSNAEAAKSAAAAFFAPSGADRNAKGFDYTAKLLEKLTQGIEDGVPTAMEYRQQVEAIAVAADRFGVVTDDQLRRLMAIDSAYKSAVVSAKNYNDTVGNPAEDKRQNMILEQQPAIQQALTSRATKTAGVAGLEATIAVYRQQKELVDQAIQQLIDSGVSDQGELAVRVAAIIDQLTQPFDALEQRATAVDFGALGNAFASLNQGFADFLPGVASAREELAQLSEEIAYSGTMTEQQAEQWSYLSSIAYTVADGGSQLSVIINELGGQFLESNAYAAELVNQLVLAEAAFRNGQISAGTYAGITANLTGTLLTLAQGAGIATNAIYALNAAQSDMSNLPGYGGGFAVGGSIANRIQSQQQSAGREQNRREMERYNRDMARAQERSASRAGKLLEDGAKKANQELKSALDKVPGLFSTTQVTEQDMKDAEMGIYKEKADEYLRRLRDEVQNGKQWEDVSIEEARAGLERAGLEVGDTAEQTLALLEKAMNDSSLYSAAENIPIFINEEAVKLAQDLQSKSEQGRKNIYEYFGVQVDEAVGAATGGGGGGGGAAPVAPPKLVDIDPLTEGLQTGLDEYVNANGEIIKEQVATAQSLFFDPANLFGTGGATGQMGPMTNPAVTVTADTTAEALVPFITGQQQATIQMQTAGATFGPQPQAQTTGALSLTPTLDTATLQEELSKLTLTITPAFVVAEVEKQNIISAVGAIVPTVNVALAISAESGALTTLTQSINTQLRTIQPDIRREGTTVAQMLTAGITTGLGSTDAPIDVTTPLITALTTNIATNAALFASPGTIVAQLIMAAILAGVKGGGQAAGEQAGTETLSTALVTNVATQLSMSANMFYSLGFIPAQNIESGFKGYGYTAMADNLQSQLTQAISSKAGEFITTGSYIGGWIQQGINQSFSAEINLTFATNAGASWGTAFMKGALDAVGGGTLVQAISDKVIGDLATEMEQP